MKEFPSRRYPKDGLGRRVRGRRTPSGKRIVLSDRDIEIFKLLRRYRFLRSTALWELLPRDKRGQSFKRFQDRLTSLFHETNTEHGAAYLDWPVQQRKAHDTRYTPSIYELSPAGESVLEERGIEVLNVTDLGKSDRATVTREFAHMMMICDTLAAIEVGTLNDPKARFVTWPEILAKAPPETRKSDAPISFPVSIEHRFAPRQETQKEQFRLVPDGLFGLEYVLPDGNKRYRFFVLEAERSNRVRTTRLKGSSYFKKILAYQYILQNKIFKSRLGLPNLLILTVTPNNVRIKTMTEAVNDIYGPSGCSSFLYNAIPVHGETNSSFRGFPDLYQGLWLRAGHEPFFIKRP
jgi:hypothetical protein